MRWHDNAPYDFSLVSTYFPVLLLVVRSSFCVTAIYWITSILDLEQQSLLIFTVCIVYVDSVIMHENQFDRACGHLCMCALAVLTQQHETVCGSTETVLIMVCDLLWSACAGVEVILRTTRRTQGQHLQKTLLCCCFACTRVALNCNALGFMQAMCRTWLYNVLCSLMLLCSPFLPHYDGLLHFNSVIYICAHVLFVHLYAVIASVILIVCVHVRLVYLHVAVQSNTHKHDNVHRDIIHDQNHLQTSVFTNTTLSSSATPTSANKDYSDLIKTLQAAKRANNIA
jgi:hypothetical protein